MWIARVAALLLGPSQRRRGPGRPTVHARGAGVNMIPQVQQADVAQRGRAETADFDVVFDDRQRLADLVRRGRIELPLEVVAKSPGENAADVEPLAFHLP